VRGPPIRNFARSELFVDFTFVYKLQPKSRAGMPWGNTVSDALQGLIEDALRDGGFETAILSSGEEALTLFRGRVADYRALVTDVNFKGSLSGWEVANGSGKWPRASRSST
jgi:hypothetical protein